MVWNVESDPYWRASGAAREAQSSAHRINLKPALTPRLSSYFLTMRQSPASNYTDIYSESTTWNDATTERGDAVILHAINIISIHNASDYLQ